MLYNSMILPFVDYCDVVFGNLNVSHLDHIQKVQNCGARIILGLDRHRHVSHILSELKRLTSRKDRTCILLFRHTRFKKNGLAAPYLSNILQLNKCGDVNSYVTRSSINGILSVPKCHTSSEKGNIPIQSHHDLK